MTEWPAPAQILRDDEPRRSFEASAAMGLKDDGRPSAPPRRGAVWRRANPSSPDFSPDGSPFFHFARVLGIYTQRMDRHLKQVGIDMARWRVLNLVNMQPAAPLSRLAELAVMRLPTMTKLVYRMEAEGLVTTSTSTSDARVTVVNLSALGKSRLEDVRHTVARVFEHAFDGIEDLQILELMRLTGLIQDNLEI